MQQCHARFYYCRGKGIHQEVPESYPEHPFDRGFHFSSDTKILIHRGPESEQHEESRGESGHFQNGSKKDHLL
jgi:hypothetical protein